MTGEGSCITAHTFGLCRKRHASVEESRTDVMDFLAAARVALGPVVIDQATLALSTFARYGKGRGHPAQLNMGDCFAYAVAREYGVGMLFKGDDFSKTDIVDIDGA